LSMIPRELTPEEEEELIERISNLIVRSGLGMAALLYLESYKPLSFVGGQLGLFFLSPILPFLGKWGEVGTDVMMLISKRENVERIIERVRELMEEESKREKERKKKEKEKG